MNRFNKKFYDFRIVEKINEMECCYAYPPM